MYAAGSGTGVSNQGRESDVQEKSVARVRRSFGLGGGTLALDPADQCESSKLKVAGKYGFCRLKAASKGVKNGAPPDFTKCDEKYSFKWQQAETIAGSGVCPSEGDELALQAFITQHGDDVAAALAGGPLPNCPADLASCQGDLALAELCGNGVVDGGEDCDQGSLDGETCVTQGFAGGTLACGAGCSFDTGGCHAARFVDNADGTISDNETGLMWEKKIQLDGESGFFHWDADNAYAWAGSCSILTSKLCQPTAAAAALCAANSEGGTTGCDECTGGEGVCTVMGTTGLTAWGLAAQLNLVSFAGHTDWRLPKRRELESIVDLDTTSIPATNVAFHGASCGLTCGDVTSAACSCTQSNFYWSASSLAPGPPYAWFVYFSFGYVYGDAKTNGYYVRAVRSGS
jgi:hypothetical protein